MIITLLVIIKVLLYSLFSYLYLSWLILFSIYKYECKQVHTYTQVQIEFPVLFFPFEINFTKFHCIYLTV